MGWRNQKKQGGEGSSDPNSPEESLGSLLRAKPSEADQLDGLGLKISLERLRETLVHAESHLVNEQYRCIVPVGSARGSCTPVNFKELRAFEEVSVAINEIHGGRIGSGYELYLVTDGPCTLLCGAPSMGAHPWVCPEHWLTVRRFQEDVERRLRKEIRRAAKR